MAYQIVDPWGDVLADGFPSIGEAQEFARENIMAHLEIEIEEERHTFAFPGQARPQTTDADYVDQWPL